jgi:hypothetical protein
MSTTVEEKKGERVYVRSLLVLRTAFLRDGTEVEVSFAEGALVVLEAELEEGDFIEGGAGGFFGRHI